MHDKGNRKIKVAYAGGSVSMDSTIFDGNAAPYGAGISLLNLTSAQITSSTFNHNVAQKGACRCTQFRN